VVLGLVLSILVHEFEISPSHSPSVVVASTYKSIGRSERRRETRGKGGISKSDEV